jgi:pimeloyl-ACP methyl ester carboxylesterase
LPRPLQEGRSETFDYHYKLVMRDPSLPTLVMLPGGPGDLSIPWALDAATLDSLLPKTYNLILTDPRGIGCNPVPTPPVDFFTTDNLASDVLAIIAARGLTDYYLFGWSYGTQLATVVASAAESRGMAPRGLVLEGTVGRYFDDATMPIYGGFEREWMRVKAALSPAVAARFESPMLPLGLSGAQWAAFINDNTLLAIPGQPGLVDRLTGVGSADPAVLAALEKDVRATADGFLGTPPELKELYPSIVCGELATSDNTDMALVGGVMVGHQDPDFCRDRPLARPFDSARYPVRAPIIYVQGDQDPATTLENARYHFDHQVEGPKHLVTVPGGSHYPFGAMADCFAAFWDGVRTNTTSLAAALDTCRVKPTLSSK